VVGVVVSFGFCYPTRVCEKNDCPSARVHDRCCCEERSCLHHREILDIICHQMFLWRPILLGLYSYRGQEDRFFVPPHVGHTVMVIRSAFVDQKRCTKIVPREHPALFSLAAVATTFGIVGTRLSHTTTHRCIGDTSTTSIITTSLLLLLLLLLLYTTFLYGLVVCGGVVHVDRRHEHTGDHRLHQSSDGCAENRWIGFLCVMR
jgi:hypothetical protein